MNASSLENIHLHHSITTKHKGNIFCAEISPIQSNTLLSAAADGLLFANYLDGCSPPAVLHQSDDIIHMFVYDVENSNIVYTAEECGQLHRIDMRIPASSASRKEVFPYLF